MFVAVLKYPYLEVDMKSQPQVIVCRRIHWLNNTLSYRQVYISQKMWCDVWVGGWLQGKVGVAHGRGPVMGGGTVEGGTRTHVFGDHPKWS